MNKYLKIDPWCILEEGFDPKNHRASESIFSIGNGRFGQRANFEETYSGETLQGNYIAGVYYPDKTRVGWWKNGYPEYFAKVLNAPSWIGLDFKIGDEILDLAKCKVHKFTRTLNMKKGYLQREFVAELPSGQQVKADIIRFISMDKPEVGAVEYKISPLTDNSTITVTSDVEGRIKNADANYGEFFWDEVNKDVSGARGFLTCRTRKTAFDVCIGAEVKADINGNTIELKCQNSQEEKYVASIFSVNVAKGEVLTIHKYASVLSSLYHDKDKLRKNADLVLQDAVKTGFASLLDTNIKVWDNKWEHSDITIEGDDEAQQGIRFNIFQLNQTYTGDDERLNIGPKGFTGEKYGGSTYWDTEAYCLPFYLCTAEQEVSRNLLKYRYKHLQKAIENGEKLGFTGGAAMYPMVTMNGEECHNEWEITFEEIHRNGAIAHAIFNYIKHTDDKQYLVDYGLEVLIGISRMWRQRVNFSEVKGKYVMLGVTGPNEYENNVNNNWYTNTIAAWTLSYTLKVIEIVKSLDQSKYNEIVKKAAFDEQKETTEWTDIIENMYYPVNENNGIFLQQDGYLDKEQLTVDDLDPKIRPLNQTWSWDRILRSCFIKQADVLQGIYLFEDRFDTETIRKNYEFYEPRTVHESSLSPCIHVIVAARIGEIEDAYSLYLRTSRLDLDDYNNEAHEGLHITSMAGTWMSVVEGFGGKRVRDEKLVLNPLIPSRWKSFSFKINFRKALLSIKVTNEEINIYNESDHTASLLIYGQEYLLSGNNNLVVKK